MKSLEKIPKGKEISLYIDHQNTFFAHPRWGKQIASLLDERGVTYSFICKHPKAKTYFDNLGLPYEYEAPNRFLHAMHLMGLLLFNAKKFHLSVFTKKNTVSYLVIIGEIIGIWAIMYVMYQFLVPSVTLLVQPAYSIEDVVYNFRYYPSDTTWFTQDKTANYIAVPYQIGSIAYSHTLSVPLNSIQYLSKPSHGVLLVTNTLPIPFTFRKGTKFTTADGLVFLTDYAFWLPAGKKQAPTVMRVGATAADKDGGGNLIGARWNIGTGTRLLIKTLTQSAIMGGVYAQPEATFVWWYTKQVGTVSEEDIALVKQKLLDGITWDNKKLILKQEFHDDNGFLLPFDNMIQITDTSYTCNATPGQKADSVECSMKATYRYPYVIWHDLMQGVQQYVQQRPSQTKQLISLQKNTVTFYKSYPLAEFLIVPTKVSAVWWYDFQKDSNQLKPEISRKIAGMSTDDAKKVVLSYPEISSVILKTSPAWSDTLPTLKSRIYFRITGGE